MESITTAELIDLIFAANSMLDLQFQFWLAITFALIVAGYVAGNRLSRNVRVVLSFLYFAATAVVFYRYMISGVNAMVLTDELVSRDVNFIPIVNEAMGTIRIVVFAVGTGASLWFLNARSSFKDL